MNQEAIIDTTQFKKELATFTGTTFWYTHSLFRHYHYTDGVRYLAEKGNCYWLIDRIFGLQYEQPAIKEERFQTWKLMVNSDKTAELTCEDGDFNVISSQTLSFTDFPLPDIKLFFIDNVLLLTSEY